MKKYYIRHDRDICIGCQACANICPKFWKMDDKDGKSNVIVDLDETTQKYHKYGDKIDTDFIYAKKTGNGEEELFGDENNVLDTDYELNKEAGECCPVNCIHIEEVQEKKVKKEKE